MSKRLKSDVTLYVLIGVGGMLGATGRYSMSIIFNHTTGGFSYATLIVNLIGCFVLSLLLNHRIIKDRLPADLFKALSVGVIGSFTTFSTVILEVNQLAQTNIMRAGLYICLNIFGGLLFCYAGYRLATRKQEKP